MDSLDSMQPFSFSPSAKSKRKKSSDILASDCTVDTKAQIIQFVALGGLVEDAAIKYGVSVEGVQDIISNGEQISDAHAPMLVASSREDKSILALDEPLVKWIISVKECGLSVVGKNLLFPIDFPVAFWVV